MADPLIPVIERRLEQHDSGAGSIAVCVVDILACDYQQHYNPANTYAGRPAYTPACRRACTECTGGKPKWAQSGPWARIVA